jgi:hypothetical protein
MFLETFGTTTCHIFPTTTLTIAMKIGHSAWMYNILVLSCVIKLILISVLMLRVVLLSVFVPSVVRKNVVMQSVVASSRSAERWALCYKTFLSVN